MRNIWIIGKYTFKEALSKKVFITFFAITTFMLAISALVFLSSNLNIVIKTVNIGPGQSFQNAISNGIKMMLVNPLFGGGLFLAIFSSSGFIPSMLEKGNIEILLSKPISRAELILGKYFGVSAMVLANIAYAILGFWLLIGFKFNYWDGSLLLAILTITFAFCLLYSLIILIGILTKSSLTAMMLTYLIFFVFSPLLSGREKVALFLGGEWTKQLLDFFYYITPQTYEIGKITNEVVTGTGVSSYTPILVSTVFIIVTLFASIKIFERKDF